MVAVVDADQLAVAREPFLGVDVVAEEPAQEVRALGREDALERARADVLVAGEVDRGDAGAVAFDDDEGHAGAAGVDRLDAGA